MQHKDLLNGNGRKKLDNKGWGPFDKRLSTEKALNKLAPKWLREVRSEQGGEPLSDAALGFWQARN